MNVKACIVIVRTVAVLWVTFLLGRMSVKPSTHTPAPVVAVAHPGTNGSELFYRSADVMWDTLISAMPTGWTNEANFGPEGQRLCWRPGTNWLLIGFRPDGVVVWKKK